MDEAAASKPNMDQLPEEDSEDDDEFNWCEFIPLFICLTILLALIIYVCVDF